MRFLEQLTAVSALISITSGSPVEKRKEAFSVHQTVAKPFIKSGPAAVAAVYKKYGGTAPKDVLAAAAANDGTVTTTPEQYDSEYLTPVSIGGQTLNLDFDTGSSDLWVFSSELPASSQSGHSIYNPARSSTAKLLSGYTWSISYGDGSGASGNVYTDTGKSSFLSNCYPELVVFDGVRDMLWRSCMKDMAHTPNHYPQEGMLIWNSYSEGRCNDGYESGSGARHIN